MSGGDGLVVSSHFPTLYMEHLFWEARKRKELHPFYANKAFALNGVINKQTLMPGVTAANRRKEAGREGREGSRDATLESSAGHL